MNFQYECLQSQQFDKLLVVQQDLKTNFVLAITPRYPQLASELNDILSDLYDDFTSNLDNKSFSTEAKEAFRNRVYTKKPLFIDLLYKPLLAEMPSWQNAFVSKRRRIRR
jgi:hypothetical protein